MNKLYFVENISSSCCTRTFCTATEHLSVKYIFAHEQSKFEKAQENIMNKKVFMVMSSSFESCT